VFRTYSQSKKDLKWVNSIEFDETGKFILLQGLQKLEVLDLRDENTQKYQLKCKVVQQFLIKKNVEYDYIADAKIEASSENGKPWFRIQVACHKKDAKQFEVFELQKEKHLLDSKINEYSKGIMSYSGDGRGKPVVKISKGFKRVCLMSMNENHIIETTDREGTINDKSRKKKWTTKKIRDIDKHGKVMFIQCDDEGHFWFVQSDDYDKTVAIKHSATQEFEVEFNISIEPNSFKVIDFEAEIDKAKKSCTLSLAYLLDTAFYFHQAETKSYPDSIKFSKDSTS
jgi:hypothetical protein